MNKSANLRWCQEVYKWLSTGWRKIFRTTRMTPMTPMTTPRRQLLHRRRRRPLRPRQRRRDRPTKTLLMRSASHWHFPIPKRLEWDMRFSPAGGGGDWQRRRRPLIWRRPCQRNHHPRTSSGTSGPTGSGAAAATTATLRCIDGPRPERGGRRQLGKTHSLKDMTFPGFLFVFPVVFQGKVLTYWIGTMETTLLLSVANVFFLPLLASPPQDSGGPRI